MSIKKGLGAIQEAVKNSTHQLKLKDGESAVIRLIQPLDEIVSVWEYTEQFGGQWHTITALPKEEDPLRAAGKKASFRSYLVVLDKRDDKVKIFKASKTVGQQILGLVEEYGDLTKRDFKITRSGEKLNTTYQFFPRDPEEMDFSKYDIPNTEEMVETMSREAILALMNSGGTVTDNPAGGTSTTENGGFPF